MTKGA